MYQRLFLLAFAGFLSQGVAGTITLDALQTGGFFEVGTPSNTPGFQNYFVGYGTTPGFPRTPERRSFFWFSLAGVGPDEEIVAATLHLKLVFGGLIFGAGPEDPPLPDTMEVFQLSATPFSSSMVTSTTLSDSEIGSLFASFAGPDTADPLVFVSGGMPPEDIEIPLNSLGISFLNTLKGKDIILTGWMPSWSHDDRAAPTTSPVPFLEASELIFGLTDVHSGIVPKPMLVLETLSRSPTVPEPASMVLLLIGGIVYVSRRPKKDGT